MIDEYCQTKTSMPPNADTLAEAAWIRSAFSTSISANCRWASASAFSTLIAICSRTICVDVAIAAFAISDMFFPLIFQAKILMFIASFHRSRASASCLNNKSSLCRRKCSIDRIPVIWPRGFARKRLLSCQAGRPFARCSGHAPARGL